VDLDVIPYYLDTIWTGSSIFGPQLGSLILGLDIDPFLGLDLAGACRILIHIYTLVGKYFYLFKFVVIYW
jgi:hypothetical protein